MANASTADQTLAGKWPIRDMVGLVRSMVDEVECHVFQKESLPEELVRGLYDAINNIEAEVIRRRAALSLVQNQISGGQVLPEALTPKDNDLEVSSAEKQESSDFQNLEEESAKKDSRPVVMDKQDTLDSLQDNIKAIQSVILFRMNNSMLSETSTTTNMVSFSILEEEMEILDGLLGHVTGSHDQSAELLQTKLTALPTLLGALFNMEIREAAEQGSDIDEKNMMYMVMENQKRTNVLRDIEGIANKVKTSCEAFKKMLQESSN